MHEAVFWLILLVAGLSAILTVAVLFRASKTSRAAEQALRDELRIGRDEARTAGKELREEVSAGLRSSSDVFSRALESLGKAQQTQLEAMTQRVRTDIDTHVEQNQLRL